MRFEDGFTYLSPDEACFVMGAFSGTTPGSFSGGIHNKVTIGFLDWVAGLEPPLPGSNYQGIGRLALLRNEARERMSDTNEAPIALLLSDMELDLIGDVSMSIVRDLQDGANNIESDIDTFKAMYDEMYPETADETDLDSVDKEALKAYMLEHRLRDIHIAHGLIDTITGRLNGS